MGESELVGALLLDQWALGWKATQVKRVELNAKDLISSAHHFVPCLAYVINPSSSLHCDHNLQFLHLRTYWKWKMMVQNILFLIEGWQSMDSPLSEYIICSSDYFFFCFSFCEAQLLLLKNWPTATDSNFRWEHWRKMEVLKRFFWFSSSCFSRSSPWPTGDMKLWVLVVGSGHQHLNDLFTFYDVLSFPSNFWYWVSS